MPLHSFSYAEKHGTEEAWNTENLTFGQVNLLVGRNATGKTRILSALSRLAELLGGRGTLPSESAEWKIELTNGEALGYELLCRNGQVSSEKFLRGSTTLVSRSDTGEGRIYAEKLKQEIEFQSPPGSIAAVARRDLLQHPFLEPLHAWAEWVDYFSFGSPTSRGMAAFSGGEILDRFQRGISHGGAEFTEDVRRDMNALGYPVEGLRINHSGAESEPSLLVKESRLRAAIPLNSLSQGMLRSLGLVLFVHTATVQTGHACLLIDDLGEGLDFDHSCQAVEWLLGQAEAKRFQLIFSTNDRFVMNKVPLENWTILQQEGNLTRVCNYFNSRVKFEDFKFTGLSNFDFFSMDFAGEGGAE